jgi:hypothetical protein
VFIPQVSSFFGLPVCCTDSRCNDVQAFPKSKLPAVGNNNFWGAGSGATRVYMQTLEVFGEPVPEVQTVTTSADEGQTLGGGFRLTYKGQQSGMLSWNVEPDEMKQILEAAFSLAGTIDVTRSRRDAEVSAPVPFRICLYFLVMLLVVGVSDKALLGRHCDNCVLCREGTRGL